MPAQQPVRILGDLIQYRPFGPGRLAQHVVQGLMIRLGNRLFHPFHVLGFRLQQTPDIVPSRRLDRSGPLAEVTAEAPAKPARKRRTKAEIEADKAAKEAAKAEKPARKPRAPRKTDDAKDAGGDS